jgi:hypothetical protein
VDTAARTTAARTTLRIARLTLDLFGRSLSLARTPSTTPASLLHAALPLQVDHDALKQYFPLSIVLPQMFAIYETLLSLKFVRQEVR